MDGGWDTPPRSPEHQFALSREDLVCPGAPKKKPLRYGWNSRGVSAGAGRGSAASQAQDPVQNVGLLSSARPALPPADRSYRRVVR